MTYPIGTRVRITGVEPSGPMKQPAKLIGRTATVKEHTPDGMNVLEGLGRMERVTGYWAFADEHLTHA